jgi:hypothetical protein
MFTSFRRQTPALDSCTYMSWESYNWYEYFQCNYTGAGTKIHWNPAVYCIIAACHAIALFMAIELIFKTLLRFKQWKSPYFWYSITTTSFYGH